MTASLKKRRLPCSGDLKSQLILVLGIIAAAVLLRLIGIDYGLPNLFVTDEYHEVMRALELGSGEFNFERTGKGGLYYILFALYGIYFSILFIWKDVRIDEFVIEFARDPTALYLIGRYLCVTISALTMFVVYKTCRRHVDSTLAPVAVLIVAVNILDIEISRQIRVDVLLSFFSILSLYFIIEYTKLPSPRSALMIGLSIGLATTTKITGVLLFAPFIVAFITTKYSIDAKNNSNRSGHKEFALVLACFGLVLTVTNPGIWANISGYFKFAPTLTNGLLNNQEIVAGNLEKPVQESLVIYYYQVMADKFGLVALPLTVIGGLIGVAKRNLQIAIIFAYLAVTFIVVCLTSNSTMYYPRYLLPMVAPIAVVITFLISVVRKIPTKRESRLALDLCIAIGLGFYFVSFGLRAYSEGEILTVSDTREVAAQWIQKNLEASSLIAVEGTKITAARNAVPLRETSYGIEKRVAYFKSVEPRQAVFLRHLDRGYSAEKDIKRFDLFFYDVQSVPNPYVLVTSQVRYIVVDPDRLRGHRRANIESRRLYDYLRDNRNAELIFSIAAAPSVRPGPTVEIFRLRQVLEN